MKESPTIRTEDIVAFLERVIFDGEKATTEQIRAANLLLSKTLPNLQSTKVTGSEADGSFIVKVIKNFD